MPTDCRPALRITSLLTALAMAATWWSCREEENFITDPSARLEFSTDTLRFDTVFTERGSATRILKIFNRNNCPVRISEVRLLNQSGAFFRINVDGIAGNTQQDIEINARDSIYLFAEVTIDPDQPVSASPFVIQDSIEFLTNGNRQRVLLEAWGQNANYLPIQSGKGIIWSPCTQAEVIWDDPRPYVIYGVMVIDQCTLNIPPGTRIYVHGGVTRNEQLGIFNDGYIFVLKNGKIDIRGTLDRPVTIQGDRIEAEFEDRAGQWSGIIIDNDSRDNHMEFTFVKNSILGIAVDSAAELTLKNVQIFNTTSVGLAGIHSRIYAQNLLVHSNGGNALQLAYGGIYDFDYCTFASFGVESAAVNFGNGICLDPPFCTRVAGNSLAANFRNCIISGSRSDEITISEFTKATGAYLNYSLRNCIVRVDELVQAGKGGFTDFFSHCDPCINATRQDKLFADPDKKNFHLDTLSIAEMKAVPIPAIPFDLEGKLRDAVAPDIGCYEYRPQ
jgi:hypothetical protein